MNSKGLSDLIVFGMQEKKAEDIVILDLRKVKTAVADFFVICSGNSDTQLDAIADSVEKEVKQRSGDYPWHREGKENREWILLDYVSVVAHIFKRDRREFYALEELWGDAKITSVDSGASVKTL
ncbi:MAG: ribosome silencing factor [Cyclobacteriaceae bacterium]